MPSLVHSSYKFIQLLLIPDFLWNALFFRSFHKPLGLFMTKVCSTAFANSSKVPSSRQILSMQWILNLLNSSLYHILNNLYLVRKCKTQQTCKQTVVGEQKQLSRQQRFHSSQHTRSLIHHHTVTFFNHVNETNNMWNSLEKSHFKGRLGSIVIWHPVVNAFSFPTSKQSLRIKINKSSPVPVVRS